MRLNVPHFRQQRNITCGLAAMRMLFNYFDHQVEEKELVKYIKLHNFGTLLTDLGIIGINFGFKVTCYTLHLSLLGPLKFPFGTIITKETLKNIKPTLIDKIKYGSWIKYLEKGGKLIWETPKISHLEVWLKRKAPCLITVNTAALRHFWRTWRNAHYLIVEGLNANKTEVVDPYYKSEKEARYKINSDILLPAWAISATKSSAFLMIIEQR